MSSTSSTPKAVLILGMHRSGTSFLAGNLQAAGLELGKVSDKAPHNKRGNKENRLFVNFNERVLNTNGGSWKAPPDNPTWNSSQAARAKALVASFTGDKPWGFKDPRTLLLLHEWETALDQPALVGIYRHPSAVVASLQKRDELPVELGLKLWCHYNQKLINRHRHSAFPLLSFDWEPTRLLERVKRLCTEIGLAYDSAAEPFFSAELIHSGRDPAAAISDPMARQLYSELQQRSN